VRLLFHPAAREEFVAAAEYYDAAAPGLGGRFLVAVRRATELALAHPEAGAPRGSAGVRRVLVSGFPYDVVYRVRDDGLEVLAVAHQRRRPGYWRDRAPGEG
jgi:plasmid stabilization system protein ParE